jgi:hypothetical protein
MNENITYHILNYINQDTNYAVVISGNYGIGKTHFIQNILFPKIQEIKVNEKPKFTTITISLFGVNSIDEVEKKIFLELFAPKDWQKKGAKIVGLVARGAGSFFNIDVDKVLKESTLSAGDLNKYNNLVICIDDLDRKSPELNLSEVYGFINNLTENLGSKVIIVANEDNLRSEFIDQNANAYSVLREKVIGISFPFQTNLQETFTQIISKFQTIDRVYFDFLIEQSTYIIDCIRKNEDNLRNLIFFVEQFKIVFTELNNEIDKLTNDLRNRKKEILELILKSYLPICLEYKLGNLSDDNQQELIEYLQGNRFDWGLANLNTEVDEQSYIDTFKNKYNFSRNDINYFDSIFFYIIGSEKYNVQKNIEELESLYNINTEHYDEKKELYEKLQYWNVVGLKFNDYRKYTNRLITLALQGELQIDEYADAYVFALRFDNLLALDPIKLKEKFIKALEKNEKTIEYKRSNFFYRVSLDRTSPLFVHFEEILFKCREINENNRNRILQSELEVLFTNFSDDPHNFILNCLDNIKFVENNFFSKFGFSKFWKIISKLNNTDLVEFGYVIERRFSSSSYPNYTSEKSFLELLKVKIEQKIGSNSTDKISKVALKFFLEKINNSIQNI